MRAILHSQESVKANQHRLTRETGIRADLIISHWGVGGRQKKTIQRPAHPGYVIVKSAEFLRGNNRIHHAVRGGV